MMRLQRLIRRAPTVREWLALLAAALIVPTAAAVVVLFVHSYHRERAAAERAALDLSRALMQAIDRELASAQGALQALATSPNLDRRDMEAFHAQAADVLHYRPGNVLVMTDGHRHQIINTHLRFGATLPLHGDPAGLHAVFASRRPMVSDLYVGPSVHRPLTSVDVPVLRGGRVIYVLSMQYFGERLGAILQRQKIPPSDTATIYDGAGHVIWRTPGTVRDVGSTASRPLAAALVRASEGVLDEDAASGAARVTMFTRSSLSNWATAIELPRSALTAGLWRALALIASGTVALFALGMVLVRLLGGRIERSIRGLVEPATALGYGAPVVLPPLHLREAKDVGQALVQAAALLNERTVQRDAAEQAERRLRDTKRDIERSEAFLRGIFEEAPDGVLLVAGDCRVMRANARAERLFDYPAGTLVGLPIDALLLATGTQDAPMCERVRAATSSKRGEGMAELRGQRRDGSCFPADVMLSPLKRRTPVILTVRDTRVKWEKEEALRRALEDKSVLLKELYHRIKNNLQLIISLFNLQVRSLDDAAARQALEDAGGRVRAMALVHERLYQSPTLASIALDKYVRELCDQLIGAVTGPQRGVTLRVDAEPADVGLDVAVPLGLILNELVCNSLKHAFHMTGTGTIVVRIAREDADTMRLTVLDDGAGLSAGTDRTYMQTLGLRLVSALSEQLRAQFSFENAPDGRGALATLVFRLAAPAHPAPAEVATAP